jgi:hypothetical protein
MQVSKTQKLREGLQFDIDEMDDFQKGLLGAWDRNKDGFDKRVHIIDPKTGLLLKFQPYRREVNAHEEVYYRRDETGRERKYTAQGHLMDTEPVVVEKKHEPTGRISK